jgi:ADP-ribose pyrophosphatase
MNSDWQILHSETLSHTPYLSLTKKTVRTPSRPSGVPWLVVHRSQAAVIAPRTPEGDYLLIRQERVPVMRETWEFPAGQVDGEVNPESILATAHRELGEEAGVECPSPLVPLGPYFSSVGFTDECCHLFLAPDVRPNPDLVSHDQHEAIHEVRRFSREELRTAVAEAQIIDANTLAVVARLMASGQF